MATTDPTAQKKLQMWFKYLNKMIVLMWRLGLGNFQNSIPFLIGRYLIITHTGRKSGRKYRTPVNYIMLDEDIYCMAGFGSESDWYRNLIANPVIEVWLHYGWWSAVAEEIIDPETRLQILRRILDQTGIIPYLFGIDPKIMDGTNPELFASYRLIRIKRTSPLTGHGGPGDLAWVWPLATLYLLFSRPVKKGKWSK